MARRLHDLTEDSEGLRALHKSMGAGQPGPSPTEPPPPTPPPPIEEFRPGTVAGVYWTRRRALLWFFGLAIAAFPIAFVVSVPFMIMYIPTWVAGFLGGWLTLNWTFPPIVNAPQRDNLAAAAVPESLGERRDDRHKATPILGRLAFILLAVVVAGAIGLVRPPTLGQAADVAPVRLPFAKQTSDGPTPAAMLLRAASPLASSSLSQQQFHDQATLLLTMDLELRFCANAWPEFQPSFAAAEALLDATWQQASDQSYDIADLRAARDEQRSQSEGLIRHGLVPAGTESDFFTCQGAGQWVDQPNR